MQEETMAVAGQCWASAQTPGKPRNVNIHSPHWLTASYDGQLPSPHSPRRSSHLTQHRESRGNCSWAADGWANDGPAPPSEAQQGAVEVLSYISVLALGEGWQRKIPEHMPFVSNSLHQQSSFHAPIWRRSKRKGMWRAKRGNGSEVSPEHCIFQ